MNSPGCSAKQRVHKNMCICWTKTNTPPHPPKKCPFQSLRAVCGIGGDPSVLHTFVLLLFGLRGRRFFFSSLWEKRGEVPRKFHQAIPLAKSSKSFKAEILENFLQIVWVFSVWAFCCRMWAFPSTSQHSELHENHIEDDLKNNFKDDLAILTR